jgi:hypothetical protein
MYSVDERNVNWDVRAFVDDSEGAKGEGFILSFNLVIEDYEDAGPYPRIFKLDKAEVYFGTEMVYRGKAFDHKQWIGPSLGSSNNMLRLSKKKIQEGNLSVVIYTEDDKSRRYKCEAGNVKVGKI